MEIFGFNLSRKGNKIVEQPSPVLPVLDDGATNLYNANSYFGISYLDIDGALNNEAELIRRYRTIAGYSVIDVGVENIVNEAIVYNDGVYPVKLQLDNLPVSKRLKSLIIEEFNTIVKLLGLDQKGYNIFRRWYIDGRIYYNIIIDQKNKQLGIQELRMIDPLKIKKIRKINKEDRKDNISIIKSVEEFFLYNASGFTHSTTIMPNNGSTSSGVRLEKDSVVYIPSGQIDYNSNQVLGYLHGCIRPANQLRMMEDAEVIYKLVRAPERRIFYIGVGNLPKQKADEYVRDIMQRYRNKVVYDSNTGDVKDNRKFASMLEDFWMPVRDNGSGGTKIDTLSGANPGFGDMGLIDHFKQELYRALKVPFSRLQSDTGFNIGRASEISRDEVNFQKFINRLQNQFANVILIPLKTQLILKGIINEEEWEEISHYISVSFIRDNYFEELKDNEILMARVETAIQLQPYIGKYFSNDWVRRNIFKQTDNDIEYNDMEIEAEFDNPIYYPPMTDDNGIPIDPESQMAAQQNDAQDSETPGQTSTDGNGNITMTMADVQHTMSKTIDKVSKGTSITIKRGGKSIAKLMPIGATSESLISESISFKKINNINCLYETMQNNDRIEIEYSNNNIILQRIA